MNANLFRRIGAYIIDIFLLGLIGGLVSYFLPYGDSVLFLQEEMDKLYNMVVYDEISTSAFIDEMASLQYQLDYEMLLLSIVDFILIVLYFIMFQFFNKGQTIGKKLLGIRVVKWDGSRLDTNNLVLRSLVINNLFYLIISLSIIFIVKNSLYFYIVAIIGFIQFILVIISVFMIIYRKDKRGLHDLLGRTKVIVEK